MMGILVSIAGAAAGFIEPGASEHQDFSLSYKSPSCLFGAVRMSSHLGACHLDPEMASASPLRYNKDGPMPGCLRIFDVWFYFYEHNGLVTDIEPCL
jgi:hypothetical protein